MVELLRFSPELLQMNWVRDLGFQSTQFVVPMSIGVVFEACHKAYTLNFTPLNPESEILI